VAARGEAVDLVESNNDHSGWIPLEGGTEIRFQARPRALQGCNYGAHTLAAPKRHRDAEPVE
jgi:hypothetical protein